MTWQTAILLQIIASTGMTLFARRLSLSVKQVFFGIGVTSYLAVAVMGMVFSLIAIGSLPALPSAATWTVLIIEGICIPAAWLIQYKTITYVGAGNAITISTLNTIAAATIGVMLLGDAFTAAFAVGGLLIVTGTLVSLRIKADIAHRSKGTFLFKLALISFGAILFAIGMTAEKIAIDSITVWHYSFYGWTMQLIGASILFALFGRSELPYISHKAISKGLLLGFMTSIAGGLYIYALSIGSLSHTVIASSGKIALTVLLAAIFLKERNNLIARITAFLLSMTGLWLILSY